MGFLKLVHKPMYQVRLLAPAEYKGGIVVRILHHVYQVHDGCIFGGIRLFGKRLDDKDIGKLNV